MWACLSLLKLRLKVCAPPPIINTLAQWNIYYRGVEEEEQDLAKYLTLNSDVPLTG